MKSYHRKIKWNNEVQDDCCENIVIGDLKRQGNNCK